MVQAEIAGFAERLDAARGMHRGGALAEARAAYEGLLAERADDADLLGLLGVLAMQEGREAEAETRLRAALDAGGPVRLRQRNLNNLFVLLDRQGRRDDARALAGQPPPCFPPGALPAGAERRTVLSLAEALGRFGPPEHALALLASADGLLAEDGEAAALSGRLRLMLGEAGAAAADLERALALGERGWRTRAGLAGAYRALGRTGDAAEQARQFARALPVCAMPRQPGQRAAILVLNPVPTALKEPLLGPEKLHFSGHYINQAAHRMGADYRFVSLFADFDGPPAALPRADLVFSNLANSEWLCTPGRLDKAAALADRTGLPVLNHPRAAAAMTRQKVAALLRGIPGLRVPRIERYRRDAAPLDRIAEDVSAAFAWPVIVRHPMVHQSAKALLSDDKPAMLVEDRDGFVAYVERQGWPEFYVIEYVDLRKPDGNFRKLRAVLFEDEVIVGSGGYYSEWMVGAWRRLKAGQEFYRANPHLLDRMNRLLLDPEGHLGRDVLAVLEAVRDRVPLDLCGIDFDVDDQGRVVMFEVAATMNFLQRHNAPEAQRMPLEPEHRINAAFHRLVARTLGRPAERA